MPDVLFFSLKQCSLIIFIFQKYETASFEKNYYTGDVQRVGFYKSLVGARSWLVPITLTFNSSPNFMNKRNMRWFLMLNQNFCITYLNLQVSVHDIFFLSSLISIFCMTSLYLQFSVQDFSFERGSLPQLHCQPHWILFLCLAFVDIQIIHHLFIDLFINRLYWLCYSLLNKLLRL